MTVFSHFLCVDAPPLNRLCSLGTDRQCNPSFIRQCSPPASPAPNPLTYPLVSHHRSLSHSLHLNQYLSPQSSQLNSHPLNQGPIPPLSHSENPAHSRPDSRFLYLLRSLHYSLSCSLLLNPLFSQCLSPLFSPVDSRPSSHITDPHLSRQGILESYRLCILHCNPQHNPRHARRANLLSSQHHNLHYNPRTTQVNSRTLYLPHSPLDVRPYSRAVHQAHSRAHDQLSNHLPSQPMSRHVNLQVNLLLSPQRNRLRSQPSYRLSSPLSSRHGNRTHSLRHNHTGKMTIHMYQK